MSFHAVSIAGNPVVQGGTATIAAMTVTGASGSTGKVVTAVATTAFAIGFTNTQETLILDPAGPCASGTVTMAITPLDGQYARIASSATISAITVAAAALQAIKGAPATFGTNAGAAWQYSGTVWYRIV